MSDEEKQEKAPSIAFKLIATDDGLDIAPDNKNTHSGVRPLLKAANFSIGDMVAIVRAKDLADTIALKDMLLRNCRELEKQNSELMAELTIEKDKSRIIIAP